MYLYVYNVSILIHCMYTYTVNTYSIRTYSVPILIQYTHTYTVYTYLYSMSIHVQCEHTYTVYIYIYSVHIQYIVYTHSISIYRRCGLSGEILRPVACAKVEQSRLSKLNSANLAAVCYSRYTRCYYMYTYIMHDTCAYARVCTRDRERYQRP